jgi:hypothetical protein
MDAHENPVSTELTSVLDGRERAFVEKRNVQLAGGTPSDVFERAVGSRGAVHRSSSVVHRG